MLKLHSSPFCFSRFFVWSAVKYCIRLIMISFVLIFGCLCRVHGPRFHWVFICLLFLILLVFVLFSFVILAPVVGNFTDEEVNGNTVPQDTLEYPLQRDEVHTQNTKGDRNHQIPSGMCCSRHLICLLFYSLDMQLRFHIRCHLSYEMVSFYSVLGSSWYSTFHNTTFLSFEQILSRSVSPI